MKLKFKKDTELTFIEFLMYIYFIFFEESKKILNSFRHKEYRKEILKGNYPFCYPNVKRNYTEWTYESESWVKCMQSKSLAKRIKEKINYH